MHIVRIAKHGDISSQAESLPWRRVPLAESLPSVNEPEETQTVIEYIKKSTEQQRLLEITTGVKI